ncbi:hypothetical protein TTHERM_00592790 (macronuclear) [Tetrahymena thermophila SB210]|uniref:Uncharacterized protein n=1 Tax=Tetrahymena thermophila (strain SB210) TaxID=312017 RepID=Q232L9_TETTS|nr:hypothetical protein TTHERM_00592790 [Tetrahymena thermophila SB210]EAR91393.2 hypothetical protein TTHERM_00592790 [Tetrahymena thermophila SB210]|eukprot:XP_001011638.2 hypothetical protein TTHERM_00592790 [Tetrahymena thermophila SB210]
MEQSQVLSQVNLLYTGKNKQNSLRHFRQQAATKQRELKKQIIEEIQQKHGSPLKSNQSVLQTQNQTQNENFISKYQEQTQPSYDLVMQNNMQYKETQVTEKILKIIENNKKLLNLKALKLKAAGIYFGDVSKNCQLSKYNTKAKNLAKFKKFKVHKLEEIQFLPSEQSELYDQVNGNKPQKFFELQKKEEKMMSEIKSQKDVIEFQNYQLDIIRIKNNNDLREIKNVIGQNNLFFLESKLLFINTQQLLSQLQDQESTTKFNKQIQENIQNLIQRLNQQTSALENTLIENEIALKTIGLNNIAEIQNHFPNGMQDSNLNQADIMYEGSQLFEEHQQQILQKVRSIEKLKYSEILNKKAIDQLKIKSDEYEFHLKNLVESRESPESLKINLKKIIEMHKAIKQLTEENEALNKKNDLLIKSVNQHKSDSKSLTEILNFKVNQLYQKLSDEKLDQLPVIKVLAQKDDSIKELNKQKDILDDIIEQNKKEHESKQINLLMQLEQHQNTIQNLEKQLVEIQPQNKINTTKVDINAPNYAIKELSNIVLSKQTSSKQEQVLANQYQKVNTTQTQKLRNEEKEKQLNELIKEKEQKIQELSEKAEQYLNIAFYLNDLLLEINDLDDYRLIRQKLDNNRENIVKYYGVTSVDFNQSPDLTAKRRGKFDLLGKNFAKSIDANTSPFFEEQFSRISQDSAFIQNIKDLKKRSESNLLNDLHVLENMGVQSMSEYMHTRLSKIMRENYELKEQNQKQKQTIDSLMIGRKSGNGASDFENDQMSQKIQQENIQFYDTQPRMDDIPDNYLYALYMQSITIEEMLKQAEEVQMITNEIEKNQEEQQKLLKQSLEFQKEASKQISENNNQNDENQYETISELSHLQPQQYFQIQQQQPYINEITTSLSINHTTSTITHYKNLQDNSIIQEQSNEDDEQNENQVNSNGSNNILLSQNQQQQHINYSTYNQQYKNNYLYNS